MFNLRRTAYQCVALRSPSTVLQHTLRTPLSRVASNTIAYNLRNNLTHNVAAMRALSSTTPLRGIEEFYDRTQVYKLQPTGRAWEASELRIKSFEDLHKLWYVLLKERNQLMTHMHDARSNSRQMPEKDRLKRVKLSMARIKVVIGERDRAVKAIHVEENNEGVKRAEKRKAKFAVYQEALRKRAEKNLLKRGAITRNGFVEKSIRLTSRAEKATHAKRTEAATTTPTETTTTSQKEKSVDEKASTAEAKVVKKTSDTKPSTPTAATKVSTGEEKTSQTKPSTE